MASAGDNSTLASPTHHVAPNLELQIKEEMAKLPVIISDPYIWRVPEPLRSMNPQAYTPFRVAIGPYHANLRFEAAMEPYKLRYLASLMSRSGSSQVKLKDYVAEVERRESEARKCYAKIQNIEPQKFKRMMLLDGAFVVEFFCRIFEQSVSESVASENLTKLKAFISSSGHVSNGISANLTMNREVLRDLILLENQLPYFILENFFNLTFLRKKDNPGVTFGEIAYFCLKSLIPVSHIDNEDLDFEQVKNRTKSEKVLHLVHLLRICCLPLPSNTSSLSGSNPPPPTAPSMPSSQPFKCCQPSCICRAEPEEEQRLCCLGLPVPRFLKRKHGKHRREFGRVSVTKLHEAGVRFRVVRNDPHMFHISFDEARGVLAMPHLKVGESTEAFFRNIMAFELYHLRKFQVTNYMHFMDQLIDTQRDVDILQHSQVIQNLLESNKSVANIFNRISTHTGSGLGDYRHESGKMTAYAMKQWNNWWATLHRDYFGSPWTVTSFIAAVVLLALTAIQTIASVRSTKW